MFSFLTRHLREINESYFTHMKHASYFAFTCLYSSVALFIHSVFPFIFVTTGSNNITKIYNIMSLRVKILKQCSANKKRIAIIGFGASGIISFYNLVKNHNGEKILEIDIFDKNIGISKGMAYATKNISHLLNVRASNMSALHDDKNHFVNWLSQNGYSYGPNDFAPRAIYNLYLDYIIDESCKIANSKQIRFQFYQRDINKISRENQYFVIENNIYHNCLLCVGAFMQNNEKNFWNLKIEDILQNNNGEIHILGAGLTAFDAVIALQNHNYSGKIFMHSRSNKLPQENLPHKISDAISPLNLHDTTLPLSKIFRKFVDGCKKSEDWRATFDAFRPLTVRFWQGLDAAKKRRFLNHCFRLWNVHRHRCPPEQFQKIQNLISSKKLILTKEKISYSQAIDCTGFNFSASGDLIKSLIENEIAKTDELSLGVVSCDKNFIIIGANNFGELFETTAIPELRTQGFMVAENIYSHHP